MWSAAAVLVGSTIGSGIFRVPSTVAADVGAVGALALLWVAGALVALFGALTIAELAAMYPRTGGIYVFLREAYGPVPAFLFGWTELLLIRPSALGAISMIFADYVGWFVDLTEGQTRLVAAGAIAVLALANYRSVGGAAVQNASTVAKVVALVGLAVPRWRWATARRAHSRRRCSSRDVGRLRRRADRRAVGVRRVVTLRSCRAR